jgi:hypothetical protein
MQRRDPAHRTGSGFADELMLEVSDSEASSQVKVYLSRIYCQLFGLV